MNGLARTVVQRLGLECETGLHWLHQCEELKEEQAPKSPFSRSRRRITGLRLGGSLALGSICAFEMLGAVHQAPSRPLVLCHDNLGV
jgi:hypothetical protein